MRELQAVAADGHVFAVRLHEADAPRACFILCPAMGVAASYYDRFAQALAARGITAAIADLRGQGSSSLRAGRACNWGYADMVEQDGVGELMQYYHAAPAVNLDRTARGRRLRERAAAVDP